MQHTIHSKIRVCPYCQNLLIWTGKITFNRIDFRYYYDYVCDNMHFKDFAAITCSRYLKDNYEESHK